MTFRPFPVMKITGPIEASRGRRAPNAAPFPVMKITGPIEAACYLVQSKGPTRFR